MLKGSAELSAAGRVAVPESDPIVAITCLQPPVTAEPAKLPPRQGSGESVSSDEVVTVEDSDSEPPSPAPDAPEHPTVKVRFSTHKVS